MHVVMPNQWPSFLHHYFSHQGVQFLARWELVYLFGGECVLWHVEVLTCGLTQADWETR
jgi:hypothetical protein